ncbi:hypothetical protein BME53_02750 [Klebsiella quasipneumoniae subsp. similipneumoniae]|nr:hypothetical protein BME54_13570 [Klebsiella quasipneumoniae]AZJ27824.1 hypothetical protein BME36_013195 [Klebsiella quasipneumoniae subsp. similipneumoniae]OVW06286.1 hypothetical protein BME61_10695 [Klebsiella quasipneumoniae subsp. similipneumoniae]OVW14749.1 hypothetical protein BME58_21285 [Klebsiella quasipneumoniae subsp. similipneumoniae]OVW22662.1 hypothetical protein BME56_20365 [Klebsiella quasipneumoniae subsp. similipneumoniae]
MMSLWDALRMNMMISYQELVRTFLSASPAQCRCGNQYLIVKMAVIKLFCTSFPVAENRQ